MVIIKDDGDAIIIRRMIIKPFRGDKRDKYTKDDGKERERGRER